MSEKIFTTEEILARLKNLHDKLEDEGWYVKANTCWLAMEEIKRLKKIEKAAEDEN